MTPLLWAVATGIEKSSLTVAQNAYLVMPLQLKVFHTSQLGETNFVGKNQKCIVLVSPKRVTVMQEQRTTFPCRFIDGLQVVV